ncbi:MAG: hypothetical protein QME81_08010, partial [bacterium]|nr:hypothetical protein [bacterium]
AQKETQKETSKLDKSMQELAEAQKETQKETSKLDKSMQELAEAQKETQKETSKLDKSMQELAEAQKESQKEISKLDKTMQELAEAQKDTAVEMQKLTKGLNETRGELGRLSRSVSYAFENEVYRMLPPVLRDTYGIELKEKLIRTEIGGKEINILGKAKKDGKDILIIGEAKLRLDERRKKPNVFEELEEKVLAVKGEYKEEVVRILITHYATKGFMKGATDKGIIVVQSFEW